ncbi:nucleoporin Pom34 [Schizosaccharomyces cryophilus OY26]|uniref:Nucleoporin Pom34 n=1 Tax=Schizosaccharomyces cryophilus (strain OY26 / ATCC MYA-4695 / CBS 11777 / NBRC 106824 / NRRL Y48691) TaxID=653667 RepID=S9W4H8_SCHCR|nr:nucleoporin Pom34 [Schizosaccharomyces cryophilus OY26]EPY53424.1 nucleoporin Pom34 [Schizosaccharomyces cryophilus OY26]
MTTPFSQSIFAQSLFEENPAKNAETIESSTQTSPLFSNRQKDVSGDLRRSKTTSDIHPVASSLEDVNPNASASSKLLPIQEIPKQQEHSTPPPCGYWKHPVVDTVSKRLHDQLPTDRTWSRMISNLFALVCFQFLKCFLPKTNSIRFASWALQFLLVLNILEAFWQFIRPRPTFDDLKLSPTQRKLLGLPPAADSTPSLMANPSFQRPSKTSVSKTFPSQRSTTWA